MPVFIAALLGALVQAAGTLVGKVLISLGIGYVAFTGVDASVEWARTFVMSQISGLGAQTVATASALNLGTCISLLTSALMARLVLNGLTGGTLKRMVQK
jgi:hypothetical protein